MRVLTISYFTRDKRCKMGDPINFIRTAPRILWRHQDARSVITWMSSTKLCKRKMSVCVITWSQWLFWCSSLSLRGHEWQARRIQKYHSLSTKWNFCKKKKKQCMRASAVTSRKQSKVCKNMYAHLSVVNSKKRSTLSIFRRSIRRYHLIFRRIKNLQGLQMSQKPLMRK